ncbi:unnamed protein product, partial [Vitis vinifera]|uniref:Uncharacterized protein n=1 Tax=Vitis vinifera TaxID=29760 RepID=D7TUW2_VITVI
MNLLKIFFHLNRKLQSNVHPTLSSSSNGSDETCVREGKEQRQQYLFAVDVTVEPSLAVGINRCVESEEDAEQCYESRGAKACAGDGASAAGR